MATYGSYKRIDSDGIIDGELVEAKFATAAITETKLGTGAVTEDKLGANAVTTAKIASTAVGDSQLGSTLDLSSKTVTYRNITDADFNAGAAVATSKISGAITDVSSNGLAQSALTDTTNASNITSGTLPYAQGGMGSELGFRMIRLGQLTGSGQQITNWHTGRADNYRTGESSNTYAWTSNNRVTVYQTGTYICLVELIPYQNTGQIDIFVRKNGSNITDFRGGSDVSNHCACSGRLIMNLNANDYIEIYSTADNGSHEDYYSSWSFAKLGGWS